MQYIVEEKDKRKRKYLYNYIHNKYDIEDVMDIDYMINSKYPFVIDIKEKILWVCTSITCLACTHIITINDFLEGKN